MNQPNCLFCVSEPMSEERLQPETISLGSRPYRVENHAISPRLITYSLSEDGSTLIIKPVRLAPAQHKFYCLLAEPRSKDPNTLAVTRMAR